MPEDRRMAISSTPRLSPDDVARHTFATARRGFDPDEVRAYLEGIASEIRARDERERELQQEVGAAEERAANPVLDDATLTAALGAETARVLRSAHEAAGELVSKAETEATRLLTESRQQIEEAEATAEAVLAERTAQADTSAADVRKRAHDDAAAQMDATRNEVESMLAQARTECRDMLDEAQGLRTRVLADLSRRRKVLHAQIEQLRAGREHLAEAVRDVRRSIDTIADDLFRAEDEARLAAEAAGREAVARADEGTLEEEAAALSEAYPGDGDRGETPIEEVVVVEVAVAAPESSDGPGDEAVPAGAGGGPPADAVFAKLRAATEDAGEGAGGEPGGQAGESSGATAAGDEEGGPMPPPTEVTRRDEALGPIVTALARRLKRTLQDDQNDVLDRLRSNGSTWSSKVLPPEPEHRDGFATAALPHLEDAALAGLRFAGGKDAAGPKIDVLIGIADGLADEVVGSLRRRLEDDERVQDADETAASEHVGSAFREWKGQRVERLARDHAIAAFSVGTLAALSGRKDATVEWVAVGAPGSEPCPDCEDNGLNGPQAPGEEFPTGHRHPPAHPGCRCVIVTATT